MARLAAREWGVLSTAELRACGLSKDGIARRVRGARLHPLFQGVYAIGHANPPREGAFLAAVKACGPGAVLSHFSAAVLWEICDPGAGVPQVTVAGSSGRLLPGLVAHRTKRLDPRDVTRHRGIPITAPARTLLDLASQVGLRVLRRAIRRAQGLGRVHHRDLLEVLDRLAPRRGAAGFRRIVATGPAPTRSVLEDAVLDLMLRGGLAHPVVNAPMFLDGRKVIPDFRWPAQRLVVEADSRAWHDDPLAREEDAERQAVLEAHGERVVRVTWRQAVGRPAQTLARLRRAGAPPAPPSVG